MDLIQWVFRTDKTIVPQKIRIKLEKEKYFTRRNGLARSDIWRGRIGACGNAAVVSN